MPGSYDKQVAKPAFFAPRQYAGCVFASRSPRFYCHFAQAVPKSAQSWQKAEINA
jgi:hypothetical protein